MSIKVNKKEYKFIKNKTLLDFLSDLGITIPALCHDERIKKNEQECGICVVEVDGKLEKACKTMLKDNSTIKTHSELVLKKRKEILENII